MLSLHHSHEHVALSVAILELLWVFIDFQHEAVGEQKPSCICCSGSYMKEAVRFATVYLLASSSISQRVLCSLLLMSHCLAISR